MNAETTAPRRKRRRDRKSSFGTVQPVGTATEPRFIVRYWDGRKRRQQSGFTTRKAAQEALAQAQTEIATGDMDQRSRGELPFDKVAQRWLSLHSATLRSHAGNLCRYNVHVKDRLGGMPIRLISGETLLELRRQFLDEGELAPGTANRLLQMVRAILKWAAAENYIKASPTDRMPRGSLMLKLEKRTITPPFHESDLGRVLEAIRVDSPSRYALFACSAYTGMRKGEVVGLRWADVDLKRKSILVRYSYDHATKSNKWRTVPMPDHLATILAEHRLRCPFKNELAFPSEDGTMFPWYTHFQEEMKRAILKSGARYRPVVPQTVRFHDLRHAFGSIFIARGGSVMDLKEIMGHSSVNTTSIYVHVAHERLVAQVANLRFDAPKADNVVDLRGGGDA